MNQPPEHQRPAGSTKTAGEFARYVGQFRPEFSRLHRDRDLFWVVPFRMRYALVVLGPRFAGVSTALAYLAEKRGFETYSLSGDLRTLAAERGVPLDPRVKLQDLGDELRAGMADGAFLARRTLRRIRRQHLARSTLGEQPRRIAVGGFKHPDEVRAFQRLARVHAVVVTAPRRIRFQRATGNGLLQRELEAIQAGRRGGAKLDVTPESFRDYIDRRDLFGWDRLRMDEGRGTRSPWTTGFDQAVYGALRVALFDEGRDHRFAPQPRCTHIVNRYLELPDYYSDLDAIVRDLDRRYRSLGA